MSYALLLQDAAQRGWTQYDIDQLLGGASIDDVREAKEESQAKIRSMRKADVNPDTWGMTPDAVSGAEEFMRMAGDTRGNS